MDDTPAAAQEATKNKETDQEPDLGAFMESNFCKYLGKPRRISIDQAKNFKTIQSDYKECVHKALSNLNDGKLAS